MGFVKNQELWVILRQAMALGKQVSSKGQPSPFHGECRHLRSKPQSSSRKHCRWTITMLHAKRWPHGSGPNFWVQGKQRLCMDTSSHRVFLVSPTKFLGQSRPTTITATVINLPCQLSASVQGTQCVDIFAGCDRLLTVGRTCKEPKFTTLPPEL